MAPLAFVPFQFWSVGFTLALLTQNVWIAMGIGYVMTNGMLWMSDHAMDPLDISFYFHVWFMLCAFVGAFVATIAASSLSLPRMAFLSNLSRGQWTKRTSLVFLMIVSSMLVIIGVNLAWCRPCAGGAGMSPVGLAEETAHLVGWICFGLGVFFTLVALLFLYSTEDSRGSVTAKYLYTSLFFNLAIWAHDLMFFPDAVHSAWPGIIYLVVLIAAAAVFAGVSYGIPASPTAKKVDLQYRNMQRVRRTTLTALVLLGVGALASLIVIWASSYENIDTALIVLGVYSVVAVIALLIYGSQDKDPYEKLDAGLPQHMSVAGNYDPSKLK